MTSTSRTVRAAVAQVATVYGDLNATLSKLEDYMEKAASNSAQLVLFPEAFIGGYPRGYNFGTMIGKRTDEGKVQFAKYWDNSIAVPDDPAVDFICKAARKHNIITVVGVIERDIGTLYCTVIFISETGQYLGKHRKVMPTAAERLLWGFGDGSTLPVIETSLGKIGAAICWENYMPLLRMCLYSKGIELYLAPTADQRDSWFSTVKHIATEGRCFVLSCNQFTKRSDYPEDFPIEGENNSPDTIMSRGGSCIINPFGDVLVGPNYEGENLLVADLKMVEIIKGKFDLDVVGHYSRPDIFSLVFNDKANFPVKKV